MTPGEEGDSAGQPPVWPGADDFREDPDAARPGPRLRLGRALVVLIALAALVLAGISVVAFLRDGHAGHPPRTSGAPAPGHVRIRGTDTGSCPGERRGTRTGRVHQLPCAAVDVPGYAPVAAAGGPSERPGRRPSNPSATTSIGAPLRSGSRRSTATRLRPVGP